MDQESCGSGNATTAEGSGIIAPWFAAGPGAGSSRRGATPLGPRDAGRPNRLRPSGEQAHLDVGKGAADEEGNRIARPRGRRSRAAAVAAMFAGHGPSSASASSHSEAPLISQDPRADNTDLYAFVSPDDTSTVTFVANYIPLEAPASGPNFPSFDDSVLYEIKIDNTGDGEDDIGYQFRFTTQTRNPNTFLYNVGPIGSLSDPNWNRPQTYSVTLVHFKKNGKVETGREERPGRARRQRADAARQHRAALDAELRRPRGGGGDEPVRRRQGLRRPA